jgi:hypothetical protein
MATPLLAGGHCFDGWLVPAPPTAMINFLATDLNGLVRILKRTLRDWGWSTQARN